MEKFQNKYRVQSIRMPKWNYSRGGKYYVTIVTKNRVCCFGNVVNGEMRLNEMGKIINDLWLEIPKHFENTYLDEYVVMPNHIHGIVVMKRPHLKNHDGKTNDGNNRIENNESNGRNVFVKRNDIVDRNEINSDNVISDRNVETPNLGVSTYQSSHNIQPSHDQPLSIPPPNQLSTNSRKPITQIQSLEKTTIPNWNPGSLGVIINQFKRICTITIRKTSPDFGWQSRFYDEIIRNDECLQQIRTYIHNNPKNWNNDEHYQ